MHAEESLLGLSQLLSTADDPLSSLSAPPTAQSSGAASSADSVDKHDASLPLPRYLFTFGLSPSGPASAEMLMSLLHHEGTKSLDSRLKECGVKSIGQRLKIQTAVKKALDGTSRVPPAPRDMPKPVACQVEGVIVMTGDVSSIKGPSASDVVRELVSAADDVEALVELAGQGDRDALTSELRRRGFKTGARYKLEQALTTMASERKTRLAEEKADAEREVVHQKHLEEQRAEAAVHMEREVKIALAAEEVRVAEEEAVTEALYEQYEKEMMEKAKEDEEAAAEVTEVEKLKQARREAKEAKEREAARQQQEAEAEEKEEMIRQPEALLADAVDGGVQGLRVDGLHVDDDGDEADEFIELK